MDGFNKLVLRWSERFYTEPLLGVCELIALVTGLLYVRKQSIGRLFLFYIMVDFSLFLVDMYLMGFSNLNVKSINLFFLVTNSLIAAIELGVYYILFTSLIPTKFVKLYTIISYCLFSAIVITYIISLIFLNPKQVFYARKIGALEFILILPLCLKYYLALFRSVAIRLFQRPSFWIATGILFYSIVSAPFYLLSEYLLTYDYIYYYNIASILFNVPFAINFIFLTISFLCKRPLTN